MRTTLIAVATMLSLGASASMSAPVSSPSERWGLAPVDVHLTLPALDTDALLSKHSASGKNGQPVRYAEPRIIDPIRVRQGKANAGEWTQVADDRWLWRFSIQATGATSIDLGFTEYWLPNGAALYVYDAGHRLLRGPFTDHDNKSHRQLWTPLIPGEVAIVELEVGTAMRDYVRLQLSQVNHGFRVLNPNVAKSLACNVDAVCPAADPVRDQVRAVARIHVVAEGFLCTGQMINNAAQDNVPYFLTANHCFENDESASSIVFYWNYQSDTCRADATSGTPLSLANFTDTQNGATLVARNADSDFLLLRLDEMPPFAYGVYWAGWDRRDLAPTMAIGVHHSAGDEKRVSVENDPVGEGDGPVTLGSFALEQDTYWEVAQWDIGVTEGGSSGSALFNQDGRVVGQLAGGAQFFCPSADEGSDVYGRLSVSWDNGMTADTRLSDWLDPTPTNVMAIDGIEACVAPSVSIVAGDNPVTAGVQTQLSASVSGGLAPYTYAWDVDADGVSDSDNASLTVSYPDSQVGDVQLEVTDATGCVATQTLGLVVLAPRLEIANVGTAVEQCGDGDGNAEPGESWTIPVDLRNVGDTSASGAIAVFATSGGTAGKATGGPDAFGYRFADSSEATCAYDFVDIAANGQTITMSDTDDGAAIVALGGNGAPFYGETLTELVMSTNGYLATSLADDGQDFDNDCGLPVPPTAGFLNQDPIAYPNSGRLAVYHDDLLLDGEAPLYQYFPACPRPADFGGAQACHVFQWRDMGFFGIPGLIPAFQAVLYASSGELVFQYPESAELSGSRATIGIQNAAADIGLQYSCNAVSVQADSAVCYVPSQSAGVTIDNAAVTLGNVAMGATVRANVTVQIPDEFPCGNVLFIDYLGTAHDAGFSDIQASGALHLEVGGDNCSANTMCSQPSGPDLTPKQGFWYNPTRSGTGIDLHFIGDQAYSAWYTAEAGRVPIWYYVQTLNGQRFVGDQFTADILKFTLAGDIAQTPPTSQTVGQATFSFLDDATAVMTWRINGQTNGELLRFFDLDAAPVNAAVTDQYFSIAEPGWGLGQHQQGGQEFSAVYFYGTDGQPRWVVTIDTANLRSNGDSNVSQFVAHCPGCPWLPPTGTAAGTLSRILNANGSSSLSLDVNLQGATPIQWLRNGLLLQQINPESGGDGK